MPAFAIRYSKKMQKRGQRNRKLYVSAKRHKVSKFLNSKVAYEKRKYITDEAVVKRANAAARLELGKKKVMDIQTLTGIRNLERKRLN